MYTYILYSNRRLSLLSRRIYSVERASIHQRANGSVLLQYKRYCRYKTALVLFLQSFLCRNAILLIVFLVASRPKNFFHWYKCHINEKMAILYCNSTNGTVLYIQNGTGTGVFYRFDDPSWVETQSWICIYACCMHKRIFSVHILQYCCTCWTTILYNSITVSVHILI